MKSFLKKLFLGSITLETVNSPINGQIAVLEDLFGRREMVAGGVEQSGVLVKKIWEKVLNFKFLILRQRLPQNFKCLILGVGGGTLIQMIFKSFPQAEITGIEIDPQMINLGKKYFGLGEIPNLKIFLDDALEKIQDLEFREYDLILVDLYCGQEFPAEAESEIFLKTLEKILTPRGVVIFNRLNYNRKHQQKTSSFAQKLAKVFPAVKEIKTEFNRLFLASSALPK